jgi:hypothetical protein
MEEEKDEGREKGASERARGSGERETEMER